MTTLPVPPRSALVDPSTGQLTREWVRFFDDLRRAIVSGLDDSVGGRLDALESDAVFAGGDGGGGGGNSYNDAPVRGRLEALETEALFPASSGAGDLAELRARMALLESLGEQRDLEVAMLPDAAGQVARLRARLADLETDNLF